MLALNDNKSIAVLGFDIFDPKARLQSFFCWGYKFLLCWMSLQLGMLSIWCM